MKACGCDFCNDLRYIEPAKYISCDDTDIQEFLNNAKENKHFILWEREDDGWCLTIVEKCPVCGYVFTEADYDSYDD